MRRLRPFIIFIVLLVIVAGLAVLSPGQQQGSPEHSSASDAPDGTSAFFAFAATLGHRVQTLTSAGLPAPGTVLFVITPTVAFSQSQASDLAAWVRGGGTVVYASEIGDTALDTHLGLRRFPTVPPSVPYAAVPGLFAGAHHLARTDVFEVSAFNLSPTQVTAIDQPLGSPGAVSMALEEHLGDGRVLALGDPCVICNAQLGLSDDGVFAADLVALASPGAPLAVDEFHHGAGAGGGGATDWISTPWGAGGCLAARARLRGFHAPQPGLRPRDPPACARRPLHRGVRAGGGGPAAAHWRPQGHDRRGRGCHPQGPRRARWSWPRRGARRA